MKKMVMLMSLVLLLGFVSVAMATSVWLEKEAWVFADPTVSGNKLQYVRFSWTYADPNDMWANNQVQFCPDPLREGCDPNVPFAAEIPKTEVYKGNIFQYDIPGEVIEAGQSALNLANDSDWFNALWLGLPDCQKLHLGPHLIYYRSMPDPSISKSGGWHILYVGPGAPFIPQAGDPRIYNCAEPAKSAAAPIAPQKRIISTPDVGAGDNKVSVKGDNNDVTPQKVQQKQKQKVSIKGNSNTVNQKQTQIGINAKTTGENSPITIHINGVPVAEDETCIKCHTDAVKKTTADKNGNVVTEQKIQQTKELKK